MPPLVAAGVTLPFLDDVVLLLVLGIAIAYVCVRFHVMPIVGFLLTGVVIGPSVLGLVNDPALVQNLAEVGVILLLFTIGLEFSLEKLARIRRLVLGAGSLQVGATLLIVAGACRWWGVGWPEALFTGGLVALSSTALVLGILAARKETETAAGQGALGVLIFQDLAVVAFVLVVPLLGGEGGHPLDLAWALGKAAALIASVLVAARSVVPWLLERVARTRSHELFLMTIVALCFGTAWLSSLADVSLALGAFLAGLAVSESPYSAQALSEVVPLQILFNAAFFVSVGMLMDVGFFWAHLWMVLGLAALVVVLKGLVTAASVRLTGYPTRAAVATGLLLAQVGEFSFVLNTAGRAVGLHPMGLGTSGEQLFIATTVLLMLCTPLLAQRAPRAGQQVEDWLQRLGLTPGADAVSPAPPLEDHALIVGYGPAGRRLATVLRSTGIPLIILDLNPQSIADATADGYTALYGDASRAHVLEAAHVSHAKLCVVAINDRRAVGRIVEAAREANPTLRVIARTPYLADVEALHAAGAEVVVPEEMESTVRLFSEVLRAYQIPAHEIQEHVQEVRAHDYALMRAGDEAAPAMPLHLHGLHEENLHTRVVWVRPGSRAAGHSLAELSLPTTYGLTVLAVRRDDTNIPTPDGHFVLAPDDRLTLVGPAEAFAQCADVFRVAEERWENPRQDEA
ncbi:monovalent cation:proton antiporter family protein [Salisaeta longa]|uniref:monovalent cation:proton antiporter family protein n=1 Tax=Salisaeta longa TaxID=503170 RepID=UPI0003B50356|nr:monovalent cation:proton antiporter family protein [Salisaeta longa]